jgi:hypothetical protein
MDHKAAVQCPVHLGPMARNSGMVTGAQRTVATEGGNLPWLQKYEEGVVAILTVGFNGGLNGGEWLVAVAREARWQGAMNEEKWRWVRIQVWWWAAEVTTSFYRPGTARRRGVRWGLNMVVSGAPLFFGVSVMERVKVIGEEEIEGWCQERKQRGWVIGKTVVKEVYGMVAGRTGSGSAASGEGDGPSGPKLGQKASDSGHDGWLVAGPTAKNDGKDKGPQGELG